MLSAVDVNLLRVHIVAIRSECIRQSPADANAKLPIPEFEPHDKVYSNLLFPTALLTSIFTWSHLRQLPDGGGVLPSVPCTRAKEGSKEGSKEGAGNKSGKTEVYRSSSRGTQAGGGVVKLHRRSETWRQGSRRRIGCQMSLSAVASEVGTMQILKGRKRPVRARPFAMRELH